MRIVVIQTNSRAGGMSRRSAWSPANIKVELAAPREALILAGSSDELDDHWHGMASSK